MKQAVLIFYLLFAQGRLTFATECADDIFKENKVQLHLCQNYSNYHQTRTLLYKARTSILNNYVEENIKSGKLQDKKFDIKIYDNLLTYSHLEITQNQDNYVIKLSGFPTGKQLITLVDYFTKKDWKPFITSNYKQAGSDIISAEINNFYAENEKPGSVKALDKTINVWSLNGFLLRYSNDTLQYYFENKKIPVNANAGLPVAIKDRMLLFQHDEIFVLKNDEIICRQQISKPETEDYITIVFKDWVNICVGSNENWIYSYAYKQNRFYQSKRTN